MKAFFFTATFLFISLLATHIWADGCYICRGDSDSYVKYTGSDSSDLRQQAQDCGCDVGGTSGSCSASNTKILCTVSEANTHSTPTGCYMCRDGSYVKYFGSDTFDLRHQAEACGCDISGTTGSCSASNNKILCSVR